MNTNNAYRKGDLVEITHDFDRNLTGILGIVLGPHEAHWDMYLVQFMDDGEFEPRWISESVISRLTTKNE
jgi:hypothetical protein